MDEMRTLTIIEETRRLMARYAYLADQKDWSALAQLFAPDGRFEPHLPDGSVWVMMTGRDQISSTLSSSSGPRDVLIHHLFSYEVDVQPPDSAHGVFAMEDLIFRPEDEQPPAEFPFRRMHGYGHYHADFIRCQEEWQIARLVQTRQRLDFTP
jgi:hypothetical protein